MSYFVPNANLAFEHLACPREQPAAIVLGYEQASWDDTTGTVRAPLAARKPWIALSHEEKTAAGLLGYTEISWDNVSGSEPQPNVFNKQWSELTTCADGEDMFVLQRSFILFQLA